MSGSKEYKILNGAWFTLALGLGGLFTYIALVGSPDVCRGVVLRDIKQHVEYTAALAAVMPDAQGSDFLAALSKGRK